MRKGGDVDGGVMGGGVMGWWVVGFLPTIQTGNYPGISIRDRS